MRRSWKPLLLLVSLVALATAWSLLPAPTQAQPNTLNPELNVLVDTVKNATPLTADSTRFRIIRAGADTTKPFRPWKWTALNGAIRNVGGLDSVAVTALAYAGNQWGTSVVWALCDSLVLKADSTLDAQGHFNWQLNIPPSQWVRVIFKGNSSAGDTSYVDSLKVARNW